jgi:L-iditol 2-dehydrogenase
MLALRLYGAGDLRLEDTPVPTINDDEILLKTEAAAICGTDIRMWRNGVAGVDKNHPQTLGHEFAGTIVEVGTRVDKSYRIGMRVGMQPNIGCGVCDLCVSGNFHMCADYRAFGVNMDGAFAEYIRIPAEAVMRGNICILPDNVSAEEAAVTEPLSCAYNGFLKCHVKPGEYALIVGAGPIGVMHAQLLNMAGARVLMNDISADRLTFCADMMPYVATYCGNDLAGFVNKWTFGRGLDIAITACPVASVQMAMPPLMNIGGRVNFFGGLPQSQEPVSIDTNLLHYRELILTGSTRSSIAQFRKTLEFVSQGLIDAKTLITDRYSLSEALSAFSNARDAKGIKHVICF